MSSLVRVLRSRPQSMNFPRGYNHRLIITSLICTSLDCIAMGRKKGHFRNKSKSFNAPQNEKQRKPYNDIIKENEKFEHYYKVQSICETEEWDQFLSTIKSDLPATFRITGSKDEAKRMLEIIQGQFFEECLSQNISEGSELVKISPLPWYPDNLAWQLDLTRKDIRRNEAYFKLHNFLITETENGTISRQETVSMIPPLLLDVKSHHKVLDMCAAPGSKTAQIIEMLHADSDNILPTGYVVANDVDNKRCYMLVHQAKRLNSPCMAVINHDSAILPNLMESDEDGSERKVLFDRVLCDVPCSGDGTLRKNPDIWTKWTASNCLHQHMVQTRILKRGTELVKVGGRIVYSTCSLNPLENEAVIHRILSETNGALQLVDVSDKLKGLKRSSGLESWKVSSKYLEFYDSFEEVPDKWKTVIRPQMFPPKKEEKSKYNLNRCVRILPHQQNTGAFFVAVLEKVKSIEFKEGLSENKFETNQIENKSSSSAVESSSRNSKRELEDSSNFFSFRKKKRFNGYKEDPFVFFKDDEIIWSEIKSFYHISDDFDSTCLLTRCVGGKKKNIYFTSPSVKDLVLKNLQNVKFINTGIRSFVRSDNRNMKCPFRLAQEGLESIFHYMGLERKVEIPRNDLITLLLNDDPQKPPTIDSLSEAVQKRVEHLTPGSCILVYKEESSTDDGLVLHISGWRGTHSLRSYTALQSTVHLLRLLGGDVSKYTINKFQKSDVQEESEIQEENN